MTGPGDGFETRLNAARQRQGLDPKPVAATSGIGDTSMLAVGMRVGVEVAAALATGLAIGWGLDRWLHTTPLMICVFALLGGAAGMANVWRLVGPKRPPRSKG